MDFKATNISISINFELNYNSFFRKIITISACINFQMIAFKLYNVIESGGRKMCSKQRFIALLQMNWASKKLNRANANPDWTVFIIKFSRNTHKRGARKISLQETRAFVWAFGLCFKKASFITLTHCPAPHRAHNSTKKIVSGNPRVMHKTSCWKLIKYEQTNTRAYVTTSWCCTANGNGLEEIIGWFVIT